MAATVVECSISLRDVQQIQASDHAFAAIRGGGSVVTWGNATFGGDCSAVQDQLTNVSRSKLLFMHLRQSWAMDLSSPGVMTTVHGGDSSAVQDQLRDLQQTAACDPLVCMGSQVPW